MRTHVFLLLHYRHPEVRIRTGCKLLIKIKSRNRRECQKQRLLEDVQSWRLYTHPSFSHIQSTNRDYKLVELFLLQTEKTE